MVGAIDTPFAAELTVRSIPLEVMAAQRVRQLSRRGPSAWLTLEVCQVLPCLVAMRTAIRTGSEPRPVQGGYAGGFVPMGKQVVDGEYADDPDELAAIAKARELRGQGLPLRAVAAALNEAGVRSKSDGTWYASTVMRALRTGQS